MGRSLHARTARFYPVLFAAATALLVLWVAVATAARPPVGERTGRVAGNAALLARGEGVTGGTPTPTACTGDYNYTYTVSSGTIVSGTNLVPGSQCGACVVDVDLPFPFTFYGQTYTSTNLSTQGNMQFDTSYVPNPGTQECPLPKPLLGYAIVPYWSSWLETSYQPACEQYIGSPCGIYTSTTGTAPNRIFNIHWRARYTATSQHTANFEARLYESTNDIQFIYGWVRGLGGNGAVGLQDGSDLFTQYSCNTSGKVQPGLIISWQPPSCWATPGPSHTPTATPTVTRTPTLTPTPTCSPLDWGTVQSPNPGPDPTGLMGVSAVSAGDVWAVGSTGYAQSEQTLIQRWDGSQWNAVTSPNPGTASSRLEAVNAVSANDIWAVGAYTDTTDMRARTLTAHWDGAQWSAVPSPNTANPNWLASVEAIASNDVWAVGYAWTGSIYRTVTLHWDGNTWSIVPSPSGPNSASTILMDVSATGPNDVWAVGYYQQPFTAHTFTMRWQGTQWTVVPSPDATQSDNFLFSVKAFDANDAWAVGWAVGYGVMNAIALRWNGASWAVVPDSQIGRDSWFFSVDGVSSQDMWAVGYWRSTLNSPRRALFRHWDGTQWHFAPAPNQGPGENRLSANAQVSDTDGWAVGTYEDGSANPRTLIMRLSSQSCGTVGPTPTYTRTPTPAGSATTTPTRTMTAISTGTATPTACTGNYTYTVSTGALEPANNLVPGSQCGACVVDVDLPFPFTFYGQTYSSANLSTQGNMQFVNAYLPTPGTEECPLPQPLLGPALLPHWDTFQGTVYQVPCERYIGSPCGIYTSTTGTAPNRIFNVNWRLRFTQTSQYTANFEARLYEGTNRIDFVYGRVDYQGLYGTVGLQDGATLFTQYSCNSQSISNGLLISWQPPCAWTPVPTSTPPSTSTATRTPTNTPTLSSGTGTPTANPTACLLEFTDVPLTNTFYPFVRCLACQGIINGYPCGGTGEPCGPGNKPYFRPNNPVTRGQLAKIVSNSAGFDEEVPPNLHTFADVPYGSAFWVWIERLSSRDIMSGYPCGGPNEPCDSENRPYFRPNTGATRGQVTKIVSNAAGLNNTIPPTQYTFADVPPTHTFWLFVERLLTNRPNVMGGYACGEPSEPCDTQNRPYFRPNNPLTRGQTSKIAAGTFYPDCTALKP